MYLANNTLLQGGKYKIVRHISSGGFGNTYEGVHTMMDTRVAIKEFFPKMFCNRDENTSHITVATQSNRELVDKLRKKFIEEAKAIFKMNHPNIVKVHDIFEENGTAYYVMDYIDGKSLGGMVKQRGALPEAEAVGYIRQVADALKYVHSLNRLHLDVKPGNVMVDANGHSMLIDFGASKYYDMESGENTSTLMGVNTKGYAPVEQSTQSFTKFSPATDIYALGATLYKLLTGITPPDANLLMAKEETLAPLPGSISLPTRNAVLKAMTQIRVERPQTVDAFLSLLNSKTRDNKIDDEITVYEEVEVKRQAEEARRRAEEQKRRDEEACKAAEEEARRKTEEERRRKEEEEKTRNAAQETGSNTFWLWSMILIITVVCIIILANSFDHSSDVVIPAEEDVEVIPITEKTNEAITSTSDPVDPVMEAEEGDEGEVFQVVEQMPEFPGGMDKLMEYLSKNIKYPSIAQKNNIEGRVIVEFVVNEDGSIVEPRVMRSVDTSLDNEAMRVIKSMPKWNPGKQRGKAVRVRYTIPVLFRLQ